jgi:transposase
MSSKIKTIEVTKRALATYKGLGQTNAQIAKRFGITTSEVMDGLITFGMVKGKSLKKNYEVKYVDDLNFDTEEETTEETSEFETADQEEVEDAEYAYEEN